MSINKVLIIGSGTMGYQIALQFAMHGLEVNLYDIKEEALKKAMDNIGGLAEKLVQNGYLKEDKQTVLKRITPTTEKNVAVKDIDLINESILEDPEVKGKLFAEFDKLCPQHVIFTSNTSQLIPAMFAEKTGRPDRFLAWHFGNPVWKEYQVDVMPHSGTDPKVTQAVIELSRKIWQMPILFKKEFSGYIHNHLMKAYMKAAMEIVLNGVADYKDVDRVWILNEGSMPPFARMDHMSLDTSYQSAKVAAEMTGDEFATKFAAYLYDNFVSKGKMGMKSGEGFYKYPHPEFEQEGFVEKYFEVSN